jgi:kynureninase
VLGLAAIDAGTSLLEDAGIGRVRAKGMSLTQFAIVVADERLSSHGFTIGPPRDPEQLGSHIALHHPEAYRLSRALIEEASTVPDFRPPDVLRIGLAPLTTSFVDVWDGFDRLLGLTIARAWERYDPVPTRVT